MNNSLYLCSMRTEFKSLQSLVGINTKSAFDYFLDKKFMSKSEFNDKSRGRVVENTIALLLDKNLPGSYKGSDFTRFEIKTIQVKYTKRDGLIRTCGDTPISEFNRNEKDFNTSNIWDKVKSVISVLVHDDIIIDVLYFNGETYKKQLKSDYEALFLGENNHTRKDGKTWRSSDGKNNKYLARKDYKNYTSSIMMMGNQMIDLSQSVSESPNLIIDNQSLYLETLLNDKISNYKVKTKKTKEKSYSEEDMKNAIEETVLQCNKKMQEFYGLLEIDVDYIFEQFKNK